MEINDRIKAIRKYFDLSQTAFAERLGVTRGVISNIEGVKTVPNEPFLKLICREFDVREDWLRTGAGDMLQDLNRNQRIASFLGEMMNDEENSPRKKLVGVLAELSADEWALLAEIAKKMAEDE